VWLPDGRAMSEVVTTGIGALNSPLLITPEAGAISEAAEPLLAGQRQL
jgi:hypothetical protein